MSIYLCLRAADMFSRNRELDSHRDASSITTRQFAPSPSCNMFVPSPSCNMLLYSSVVECRSGANIIKHGKLHMYLLT